VAKRIGVADRRRLLHQFEARAAGFLDETQGPGGVVALVGVETKFDVIADRFARRPAGYRW